jgi:hypothetical protein
MKLRVGEAGSRFTPDLDATRSAELSLEDYINQLADRLAAGWGGFGGTIEELEPPQPAGVPRDYVMQPFVIRLAFKGRHWLTVPFEIGHDEIGSTATYELAIAADLIALFDALGLDTPDPIPVLALDHQIAQKLHACTSIDAAGRNDRAHDLVDLQILDQEETIDMPAVGRTAMRLFTARRGQPWPPTVVAHPGWDTLYAGAADGLDVIADVEGAVAWTNDFIARTR